MKKHILSITLAAALLFSLLTGMGARPTDFTDLYTMTKLAAVLLVVALTVGTISTVKSSGIRERNTTALTVGNHEISHAELN